MLANAHDSVADGRAPHQHLDQTAQQAAAGDWRYTHFLGNLPDAELEERRRRSIDVSLKFEHFPYHKQLEELDDTAHPSIDRRLIDELATTRICAEGRNIVLLGPPGVGKTFLANPSARGAGPPRQPNKRR